jgi:hypothetical protein
MLDSDTPANSHPNVGSLKTRFRLGRIHWLPVALLAAAWPWYLRAGSLGKAWEVDLRTALQSEHLGPHQSFKVNELLFSPDGQQIAVLLAGRAALLRVQNPYTVVGQFQSGLYDSFGWSPDGQIIHSGRHVVRLAGLNGCELPEFALWPTFMSNGGLIALFLDSVPLLPNGQIDHRYPDAAHLRFYDADCRELDDWKVPASWLIMNATPERGLLLVSNRGSSTELIVNPYAKEVLHGASGLNAPRGRFAESGRAICGGNICWDVDTGKKIGEAGGSGAASGVAARSSRVVLEDPHAGRRWVWDFRSGKEVVSWRLKFLTYSISIDLDGFNRDRRPIPCTISPDGEYIVEGGDGKIWLYEIQP